MSKSKVLGTVVGMVLVGGLVVGVTSIEKVKPGYVGVVYSPSKGVAEQVLNQGWHFVTPFKKVTPFTVATEQIYMSADKREGSKENDSLDVVCKDGKMNVDLEMAYSFDAEMIPEVFAKNKGMSGEAIVDTKIRGKIKTYVNEVTSKYTVMEAYIEKKSDLNKDLLKRLQDGLKPYGIIVESANFSTTRVDKQIEDAILRRSKAAQELEAAKQEQEKATVESERNKVVAEGKAEVQRIEAEAKAEANKKIETSLTKEMLQQQWIEKWDGKLPQVSGSDSIVNLK